MSTNSKASFNSNKKNFTSSLFIFSHVIMCKGLRYFKYVKLLYMLRPVVHQFFDCKSFLTEAFISNSTDPNKSRSLFLVIDNKLQYFYNAVQLNF